MVGSCARTVGLDCAVGGASTADHPAPVRSAVARAQSRSRCQILAGNLWPAHLAPSSTALRGIFSHPISHFGRRADSGNGLDNSTNHRAGALAKLTDRDSKSSSCVLRAVPTQVRGNDTERINLGRSRGPIMRIRNRLFGTPKMLEPRAAWPPLWEPGLGKDPPEQAGTVTVACRGQSGPARPGLPPERPRVMASTPRKQW